MNSTQNKLVKTVLLLVALFISDFCLARAGGGGSVGGSNGILVVILAFILAPFFLIYAAIVTVILRRKTRKAKKMIAEISRKDKLWNYRSMIARVEEVYFKVQKAWAERNQNLARECMSDRIFEKHKFQTDEMIANKTKNVLTNINLIDATIFSVSDYKDNSLDTFSVRIKGSMVDYIQDEVTRTVLSGDHTNSGEFKEIWTFIRVDDKWVLDEIDQDVSILDLGQGRAYKE